MKTIGNRLKEIRGDRTMESFASLLRSTKQNISRYEKDFVLPGVEFLTNLSKAENININWLLTGEGNMHSVYDKNNSSLAKENADLKRDLDKINDVITTQVFQLNKIVNTDKSNKRK